MKLSVHMLAGWLLMVIAGAIGLRGGETLNVSELASDTAEPRTGLAEEEPVELVTWTCACMVVPEHDWRFTLAGRQFGLVDYGNGALFVWNDNSLGRVPYSAPKLAGGLSLTFLFALGAAGTLRTRGADSGGAS